MTSFGKLSKEHYYCRSSVKENLEYLSTIYMKILRCHDACELHPNTIIMAEIFLENY